MRISLKIGLAIRIAGENDRETKSQTQWKKIISLFFFVTEG